MPNFLNICRQMNKLPIQAFYSDLSVCKAAICYTGPIPAVPTTKQILGEEETGAKFQIHTSKTEGLFLIFGFEVILTLYL